MLRFIQPTLCMDCKQKQSSKITVKKLCTDFFWIARTLFIFRLLLLKAISSRNTIIPASSVASFNLRRNNAIYLFYVVCFVKKVYIIFSLKQGLIDRENSCHVYYYSRTCHNHHLKSLDKIGCKIGPSRFKQYDLNLVFYQIYSFGFICIAQENNFYMEIDSLSLFSCTCMFVCII